MKKFMAENKTILIVVAIIKPIFLSPIIYFLFPAFYFDKSMIKINEI